MATLPRIYCGVSLLSKYGKRRSGVLMHISSLPGNYGTGDFGPEAYCFADFLQRGGYSSWQVLPLSPVSEFLGNSPYSSSSAFAMNYLFVSPEKLVDAGLVEMSECLARRVEPCGSADYEHAGCAKRELLDQAWERFSVDREGFWQLHCELEEFCFRERHWLDDYALFYVLKEYFENKPWSEWPSEYKSRRREALDGFLADGQKTEQVDYIRFVQFLLNKQWNELRAYCGSKGVGLIGDIPIYVGYDSSDVWAGQEYFDLDHDGRPNNVAGVPPDYFSATGQRWGNPVYRWDVMLRTDFRWWVDRLRRSIELFDRVRIDHFRGLCRYWAIPAGEETAVNGSWQVAPGRELFEVLQRELVGGESGALPIFAEDLGVITEEVHELMDYFALPGIKVLLFAFGGDSVNPYLPHNYGNNCIVYTGTHDNDTVKGWWENTSTEAERSAFAAYAGTEIEDGRALAVMNRLAIASVAREAIIPVQDILGLDGDSRMNMPSCAKGCWRWRMTPLQMEELTAMADGLREINLLYGRCANIR